MELPKSLESYDANVVEAKLKPWLELTRSFACEGLKEQVRTHVNPLIYKIELMRTRFLYSGRCSGEDV
jgi:hypothetical protein